MEDKRNQKYIVVIKSVTIALCCSALGMIKPVLADGWEITQDLYVSDNVELMQSGIMNNSSQALNYIVSNELVNNSSQYVSLGNKNLRLIQESGVSDSIQAANLLSAEVQQSQQTLSNTSDINLRQGGGSGNIQAINAVISNKTVANPHQQVSAPSSSLSFYQNNASSGNIQAANYLQAKSATDAIQSLSVDTIHFEQAGNDNLQAGNVIVVDSNAGLFTQNFSAKKVTADFSLINAKGSVKAANFIQYKKQ